MLGTLFAIGGGRCSSATAAGGSGTQYDRAMSTPAFSELARRLIALDVSELYELNRLRLCNLRAPETFASERDELVALRTSLQHELALARAVTQKDWPLSYSVNPIDEFLWRRPIAEKMRKAEDAAREEKARLKREADEERLTYRRQKLAHEKKVAAEAARNSVTTAAPPAWQAPTSTAPARPAPNSAARPQPATSSPTTRTARPPTSSTPPRPPTSSTPPRPATSSTPPRPATNSTLMTRPASSETVRPAIGSPPQTPPHPVPARELVPGPGSHPVPAARQAQILQAVRSSPSPISANKVAAAVGGRKTAVLDDVRALLRVGLLIATEQGLIATKSRGPVGVESDSV